MIETYYIGTYWGIRKETVEECAQRAADFLTCLSECDPCFAHWFKLGRSRKEALKYQITPDGATLRALLLAGRSRTDVGRKIIEDLGFRIGLWNGASDDAENISLTLQCGSYAPRPGINSCVVRLPYDGPVAERVLRIPVLIRMMECVVSAWDPDWATVISRRYQELVPFPSSKAPQMGWLVYLSARRGVVPPLPPPARVVPVGTHGSLIIMKEERFTASNPLHVETASRVAAVLDEAGLLGPLI